VEINGTWIHKGAIDAVLDYLKTSKTVSAGAAAARKIPVSAELEREVNAIAETIAKSGGTPLPVEKDGKLLGVIDPEDVIVECAEGNNRDAADGPAYCSGLI